MKVFIGGSKTLVHLTPQMCTLLDELIQSGTNILVGDCRGADTLVQQYLAGKNYRRVTVYASGTTVRNNAGNFTVKLVPADSAKGFDFYRQKDIAMANEADSALMFWDGKSKGTQHNISDMKAQNKPFTVVIFSQK